MLGEIAAKYYKMGYNCAEATVRAGNEFYNLGLCEHDMRMMAGFGGGFFTKDICGVLSGAVAAISCRYVETKAHDNQDEIKAVVQKMMKRFEEIMGSRLCAEVKEKYYTVEAKCCHEPYTYGAPGFPTPHFDLEFWVRLPKNYGTGAF